MALLLMYYVGLEMATSSPLQCGQRVQTLGSLQGGSRNIATMMADLSLVYILGASRMRPNGSDNHNEGHSWLPLSWSLCDSSSSFQAPHECLWWAVRNKGTNLCSSRMWPPEGKAMSVVLPLSPQHIWPFLLVEWMKWKGNNLPNNLAKKTLFLSFHGWENWSF